MNKNGRTLLIGIGLWSLSAGMLGPLFAVFGQQVGGNILDISWAWAVYLILMGLTTILVGKYSDKNISKEKLLIIGFFIVALFTYGYLLVSSPIELLLVQAGIGIGSAFIMPTWDALYAESTTRKKSGFAWGLAEGVWIIIAGIAIIVGGLIVNYSSFTVLFFVMGTIQLFAASYLLRIYKK